MNYSRVKERVRANAGWSSTDDLTTERLGEAINHIYMRALPDLIDWSEQGAWCYVDVVDGTDEYDYDTYLLDASGGNVIGTRVRKLVPPAMLIVDADTTRILSFTYDADGFWKEYPPYTNEEENQPIIVLSKDRRLWFRPVPDDSYTFKCWGYLRPATLSSDSTTIITGWEEALIAGATALLKEDDEEDGVAQGWWAKYSARAMEIIAANKPYPGRVKAHW